MFLLEYILNLASAGPEPTPVETLRHRGGWDEQAAEYERKLLKAISSPKQVKFLEALNTPYTRPVPVESVVTLGAADYVPYARQPLSRALRSALVSEISRPLPHLALPAVSLKFVMQAPDESDDIPDMVLLIALDDFVSLI